MKALKLILPTTSSLYTDTSKFQGFNTLRFIAAFLVILQHCESMKLKNSLPYLGQISLFHNGSFAVTFFFVLSGFLITFFLLKEKRKTTTINIRRFYIKRVLRIFPLYFLLVIIGTIGIPLCIIHFGIDYEIPYSFGESWYYYLIFLPCLVTFYFGHHLLEPLWSIGVEVFFYTIWAPILKVVKKMLLPLLLSIILVNIVLSSIDHFATIPKLVSFLISTYSIDAMAIGGLGAYFIFNLKRHIHTIWLFRKSIQYAVIVLLLVFLFFDRNIDNQIWNIVFRTPILSSLLIHFSFVYLLIAISLLYFGEKKKENKVLWYFGEISYGLYMFHTSVISVIILLINKLPLSFNAISYNILFYILVIGGTLLVSHISKKYFENFFLGLRIKSQLRKSTLEK